MGSGPSIDWEDLKRGYNRIYKTQYNTVKDLMVDLYENHKSITKISNILGPSAPTISSKLRSFLVKINKKGGANRISVKRKALLDISKERLRTLSKIEIMKETKLSESYLEKIIKEYNLEIRILPNSGGRHYGNR